MSKSKISRLVSIPEFDGATGTLGIYRSQLIGPIDMDNWARLYLSAIENLLSASMGCKVYEKDPPMYRSILSLKEQLAKIIPETLDPILEPTESERINVPMEKLKADAAEKLKQHLLIKLTNAYDIETIVSFPVSVPWSPCTESQAQLPQLYGGIKVQKIPNLYEMRSRMELNQLIKPRILKYYLRKGIVLLVLHSMRSALNVNPV